MILIYHSLVTENELHVSTDINCILLIHRNISKNNNEHKNFL